MGMALGVGGLSSSPQAEECSIDRLQNDQLGLNALDLEHKTPSQLLSHRIARYNEPVRASSGKRCAHVCICVE